MQACRGRGHTPKRFGPASSHIWMMEARASRRRTAEASGRGQPVPIGVESKIRDAGRWLRSDEGETGRAWPVRGVSVDLWAPTCLARIRMVPARAIRGPPVLCGRACVRPESTGLPSPGAGLAKRAVARKLPSLTSIVRRPLRLDCVRKPCSPRAAGEWRPIADCRCSGSSPGAARRLS